MAKKYYYLLIEVEPIKAYDTGKYITESEGIVNKYDTRKDAMRAYKKLHKENPDIVFRIKRKLQGLN